MPLALTVRVLVQEVDVPRRRLCLALQTLADAHQTGAATQSNALLSASAGEKRSVEPLDAARSCSGGSKRLKQ